MYTKSTKWLTYGDILAEDIRLDRQTILKTGTPLSIQHILLIQALGISYVNVKAFDRLSRKIVDHWNNLSCAQEDFLEFVIQQNQNKRYYYLIDQDDDFFFLTDLFEKDLQNDTVLNLLSALKLWDIYSYKHSLDVFIIGTQWLRHMNIDIDEEISTGFLLHDIGKIKTPQSILMKNGNLTSEEMNRIRQHPIDGYDILSNLGFSERICEIAKLHHVRLNHTGYPGPFPAQLPFIVKIAMIVDVFSALTLDRPYRNAVSFKDGLKIIYSEKENFDPDLLEKFMLFIQQTLKKSPILS